MSKFYTVTLTETEYMQLRRLVGLFQRNEEEEGEHVSDPWAKSILEYLKNTNACKIAELLGNNYSPQNASRVAKILRAAGWKKMTKGGGRHRVHAWVRINPIDIVASSDTEAL